MLELTEENNKLKEEQAPAEESKTTPTGSPDKASGLISLATADMLRQQIRDLDKKLIAANKTITELKQEQESRYNEYLMTCEDDDDDMEEFKQGPPDNEAFVQVQLKLKESEALRAELENEVDRQKVKSRCQLMQKDLSERRMKMVIEKLENHLVGN